MQRTPGVGESSRPKFSYGTQQDITSANVNEQEDTINAGPDWLAEAKVNLTQDLDTSRKELDIIGFILEELELRAQSERSSGYRAGQRELMAACRKYSSSHCHLLRERLRQIQLWARMRMMGHQVPERVPEEVSRSSFSPKAPNQGRGGLAITLVVVTSTRDPIGKEGTKTRGKKKRKE
ncbi:hypothetical protein F4861DRAFT_298154 [Xylaria intraflava]|nr:hypothetical protein F4861DRAFT_298154 [Xylaria intraflava]